MLAPYEVSFAIMGGVTPADGRGDGRVCGALSWRVTPDIMGVTLTVMGGWVSRAVMEQSADGSQRYAG